MIAMCEKGNTSWFNFYQEEPVYSTSDQPLVLENRFENAVATAVAEGKNRNVTKDMGGRVKSLLKFTLKEFRDEDQDWVQQQETKNKENVQRQTVTYPSLEIVSGKWIRVEHQMSTGDVWVILEQFPNKHNRFTGLRLTGSQWTQLNKQWELITSYMHAAEMGLNWKIMARNNHHYYEETQPSTDHGYEYCQEVRFQVCDDSIYVVLKSNDPWNYGGCRVDIRKCVHVQQKYKGGLDNSARGGGGGNQKERFIYLLEGIALSSGGFDYLVKYLVPQVNEAIELYEEMFMAGRTYFQRRFNTFPDSGFDESVGGGRTASCRRIQNEERGVDEPDM